MLLRPKEFAVAIGVKYTTLRQHIKRKKVFKSGDWIDTEFAANLDYINEQTNGKGINIDLIPKKERTISGIVKDVSPDVSMTISKKIDKSSDTENNEYYSLNLRRKIADAEKAEKDNELKSMEIAKKMGELMPIEMVEKILTINIQHLFRGFESESENIASEYCEILGGDRSHLSEMVKQMRKHLEKSISEIKRKSAQEIKAVIRDYADVRSRGQRR